MKKNGFTLVELVVTIVILSILSLIFIPLVSSMIEKNNQNMKKQLINSIESAASMYMNDNKILLNLNCNEALNVTVSMLTGTVTVKGHSIKGDYLKGELVDKTNNKVVKGTSYVKATAKCDSANTKFIKFEYATAVLNY